MPSLWLFTELLNLTTCGHHLRVCLVVSMIASVSLNTAAYLVGADRALSSVVDDSWDAAIVGTSIGCSIGSVF